jgi:hypothetical protein
MNALLGIAKITRSRRILKWCAIKRHKQYQARWAKEKSHTANVTLK